MDPESLKRLENLVFGVGSGKALGGLWEGLWGSRGVWEGLSS